MHTHSHLPSISLSSFVSNSFLQVSLPWGCACPLTDPSHSAFFPDDPLSFFGKAVLETLWREEFSSKNHSLLKPRACSHLVRRFSVSTGCSGSEGHPLFIKLASSCTHQPPLSRTLGETCGSVGTILIKEDARDGESGIGGEAIMWFVQINLKWLKCVLKDTNCSFDRTVIKGQEN